MTAPDPGLPRIDALDLRPATDEPVEIEWDWPTPPAVSIEEKQGDPHTLPSVFSAGRPN